jgi:hypothetical protein
VTGPRPDRRDRPDRRHRPDFDDEPGLLRAAAPEPSHWWGRRLPSVLVLVAFLALTTFAVVSITSRATEVLPEVGKDRLGADNWSDPLGIQLTNGFQVGRIPDCAAGAFTRFVLWNPDSEPYWEVVGPPTPINTFLVGVAPEGFTTLTDFRDPPVGEVLRLVAFRRDGGAVGVRYRATDLRTTRVVSGNPLAPYTVEGFQTARLCGTGAGESGDEDDPAADASDDEELPVVPPLGPGGVDDRSTTTLDDGTAPLDGDDLDDGSLDEDVLDDETPVEGLPGDGAEP